MRRLKQLPTPNWLRKPLYHRFLEVIPYGHAERGKDATLSTYQRLLWHYLHTDLDLGEAFKPIEDALAFNDSTLIRTNINALFLGGASLDKVQEVTKIDPDSLEAYADLFCDASVFGDVRMFKMEYVQLLPLGDNAQNEERELYKMAVDHGWEWVIWKLSRGHDCHVMGPKVIDNMIHIAYYKAMEASAAKLGTKGAQEARHYLKLASEIAIKKHGAKIGEISSIQDLIINLSADDPEEFRGTSGVALVETPPLIEELLYKSPNPEQD